MNIQKYIESGVIEEYCLGMLNDEDQAYLIQMTMLYPEIKAELTAIELAVEKLAGLTAIVPGASVKQNVFSSLGFYDTDVLSLDSLPVINHAINPEPWLNVLGHLIPEEPAKDFALRVIRKDEKAQQMLIISKVDVPEEEHSDLFESFFILKGRCECTIGEGISFLGPGDFINIPLHTKHNIKVLTPVVVAILQYKFA